MRIIGNTSLKSAKQSHAKSEHIADRRVIISGKNGNFAQPHRTYFKLY